MNRAWQAIDNSERIVTHDSVVQLFQNLLAPFGEEHPFSCIPAALTLNIGRPPSDWPFIRQNANKLFANWGQQANGGGISAGRAPAERRRRHQQTNGGGSGAARAPAEKRQRLASPGAYAVLHRFDEVDPMVDETDEDSSQ